jgi:NADH-quinone oxidoreductase subunit N
MNAAAFLPEIIVGAAGIILMMVAAFGGRRSAGLTSWAAVAALIAAAAAAAFGEAGTAGPLFGGLVVADLFGAFGKVVIFLATAVAVIAAHGWFERDTEHGAEYPVLMLLAATGMSVMVSATSTMSLYVGLELSSLSSYVLASYRRTDERSAEAGLKYFVLGGLASGILLYGISLLYGYTGTTSFDGIAAAFARDATPSLGLMFGLVFLLAGMAFKISAVPFHMWTPDVYEGAPTPVTAFFAAAPKAAAVLLATRICLDALAPAADAWRQIVIVAALGSIALGAIAAWGQTNIKRLLAYSSINNVGFALVGLVGGGPRAASSVLFYIAIYVVMTLGAFLCVLRMKDEDGTSAEGIDRLSGLSQTRPGLALAISMFMFSLAGVPPLFGFWPKYLVFTSAADAGYFALAVAAAVGTVVGAFYYIKIVKIMYFDAPAKAFAKPNAPVETALIAAAALIISPLGFLLIGPLGGLADRAASSLF